MRTAVLFIVILVAAVAAFGQAKRAVNDWESKPVEKWDLKDVGYLLDDSPWSRTVKGHVQTGPVLVPGSIRFRLYSALNIRLALIRKLQLSEKFDLMDAKEKDAFNARYKAVLECPKCDEFYIIALKQEDSSILSNAMRVEGRSESIYLSNEKGEKRKLASFSPGSEALFFFPRKNDKGEPLLTAENKMLVFNFRNEAGDDAIVQLFERVYINVREIVRDGKVIF